MKKFYSKNCFYSNCLLTSLIVRLRVGGSLKFVIKLKPIGIHFMVEKNNYLIDFSPVCFRHELPLWRQIIFYGTLRVRKRVHVRYFI